MSELISGKEALIALANGEDVEIKFNGTDGWHKVNKKDAYSFEIFLDERNTEFRLKPRTITINGIEVPAPFEPKEGEGYWYITDCECGYGKTRNRNGYRVGIAAWRTEEEIKQVVGVLRKLLNP